MDELDRQEGLQEEEPEETLVSTEPVDRDSHVAVIHDSFGECYVNVALMLERAPTVSVLRVLGARVRTSSAPSSTASCTNIERN